MRIRDTFRACLSVVLSLSLCAPVLAASTPDEQPRHALELLASATPAAAAGASAVAKPDHVKRADSPSGVLVSPASTAEPGAAAFSTALMPSPSAASHALQTMRGRAPPLPIS